MTTHTNAQGWSSDDDTRHKLGIVLGHGGKQMPWTELDIPYEYQVNLIHLQYNYTLKPGRNFEFDLVFEPQYNNTQYYREMYEAEVIKGYEMGMTAGIAPRVFTTNRLLGAFLMFTTGPMYVSGAPNRQADGFNFSSSLVTGIQVRFQRKIYIDLRTGIRHISNANLREPNGGLNNLIWSVGLSYAL